jgi:ribosome biogenesis GTPase
VVGAAIVTSGDALVVAAHGRRGIVELPDGSRRGFLVRGRRLQPVCGDRVVLAQDTDAGTSLLVDIRSRRSALARETDRGRPEILAANLEQILVVCAATPEPDFFIVDRYLCAAELLGCRAVVLWNKTDLASDIPAELDDYRRIGYRVLPLSATRGDGLRGLRDLFDAGTAIMVGQSGVGKSSLINALCGEGSATTAELSGATGEGQHNTTASVLHRVGIRGRLIDAPGVRDFAPVIPDNSKPADGFTEIRRVAVECRFADCRHLREPDCAVKLAVATGAISARRYESYRRIVR